MSIVRVASIIVSLLVVAAISAVYIQRSDRQRSSKLESANPVNAERSTAQSVALETPKNDRTPERADSAEPRPTPHSVDTPGASPPDRAEHSATSSDVASRVRGELVPGTATSASGTVHPFPVSKSVRNDCEGASAGVGICVLVTRLLKQFAEELRDASWASDMEERIRASVDIEESQFAIRRLECRTSVCAVEVESIYGPYMGMDYQTQVDNRVEDSVAAFGDEKDTLGQHVTVTLRLLERE